MKQTKTRAFLKWAGGKYSIVEQLQAHLPEAPTLVEPFVGAGSVFLNTNFEHYWLNDINQDLISLYQLLKQQSEQFIRLSRVLFEAQYNQAERYYALREEFNLCVDPMRRAVLFLYLNRHGYNGLCRYNLSGKFNVPFGRYKAPYFPEKELRFFAAKAQRATFTCLPFEQVFCNAPTDGVIYCDPPYAPLSKTANFTGYARNGFNMEQQEKLALVAKQASERGNTVLISNHDTLDTRRIYQGAQISRLQVARFISQKGHKRQKVTELMALYRPQANASGNQ